MSRKAGYHHGDLPRALLDGGLHLLRTGGIAGLTLRECARLAGVSQAAIRNHYPDKNALLAGLATRGFDELARRRIARRQPDPALGRWLALVIGNYVEFAVDCPDLYRLMFAFDGLKRRDHPVLDGAAHASYGALRVAFGEALAAENVDAGDLGATTFLLWSAMHGLAMLLIDNPYGRGDAARPDPQARCRELARWLDAGLRAPRDAVGANGAA